MHFHTLNFQVILYSVILFFIAELERKLKAIEIILQLIDIFQICILLL